MKPSLRDHLTILFAFLTVFVCGYGVGHLVAEKPPEEAPAAPPAWEEQSLAILIDSLDLDSRERTLAEMEIHSTAAAIRLARERTILVYHQELSDLYQRLIDRLGEPHASRLRIEKEALDAVIERLRPNT